MKHMTWCRVSGVSAIVLSVLVSAGSALADPKGLWQAQDGAHVQAVRKTRELAAFPARSAVR